MEIYGIKFVGLSPENAHKLLLTVAFIAGVILLRWLLRGVARLVVRGSSEARRGRFWTQQGISILSALLLVVGIVSIWLDDPRRLTTAAGLVTAGLAFALQKVITALAGYFVILRGKTFTVGDRITMGGVRGDVIALGFLQTTIMEMGQPAPVDESKPARWIHSRQFTGRIVTVSNSQIFDEPVYNYTRDFPYLWDEIHIPITYQADRKRAEEILLAATTKHAITPEKISEDVVQRMERLYELSRLDLEPRIYWRMTDNWLELAVRFLAETHGVRALKDAIYREILAAFDEAKIGVASATYDIVGFPPIEIRRPRPTASER
jgi:small-conductance mechanosensitive channel